LGLQTAGLYEIRTRDWASVVLALSGRPPDGLEV
jgi:hypothetical protein